MAGADKPTCAALEEEDRLLTEKAFVAALVSGSVTAVCLRWEVCV